MTREEAKREILFAKREVMADSWIDKAYDVAIKALEQPEPCEDAVSREAVSKWLKQYGQDVLHGKYKFSLMYIWKNLMDLPSVQPEQRWIPVTEKLPEDLEEVNVTWINHIPEPYYNFLKDKSFTGSAVYYRGDWYWYSSRCTDILAEYGTNGMDKVDDGIEITAWMPLPEPYRGEGGK